MDEAEGTSGEVKWACRVLNCVNQMPAFERDHRRDDQRNAGWRRILLFSNTISRKEAIDATPPF